MDRIIAKIDNETSKEEAFFGLYHIDHEDEVYIKANRHGLELFACELLKASKQTSKVIEEDSSNVIQFTENNDWIRGDIRLGHIEPISEERAKLEKQSKKLNWKDNAVKYGCYISIIILIMIFIIGIKTIASWFA